MLFDIEVWLAFKLLSGKFADRSPHSAKGVLMQQAVRSYLAAGVAFAGVGVLAASPVTPSVPDLKPVAQSAAVELSALVNPVDEFGAVFAAAFQNAVALGQRIAEDPTPILAQIVRNQLTSAAAIGTFIDTVGQGVGSAFADMPAQLRQAAEELGAGNISAGLNTLLGVALSPVMGGVLNAVLINPDVWAGFQNALRQPIANALAVVDLLSYENILFHVLAPLTAPIQVLMDVTGAVGAAGDGIVAGLKAGNLETVANAVLHAGPAIAQALLNGNSMAGGYAAGLLGPNGIVAGLLTLRDLVADAITPAAQKSALSGVAALTAAPVSTVTLDVAPQAKAIEATKAETETVVVKPVSTGDESTTTVTTTKETVTKQAVTEESTPQTADTAATDADVVKDAPKVVVAKTSAAAKKAAAAKELGDGVRGALKNVGTGLKNALGGKTAQPAKPDSAAKSGGSSTGSGGSASDSAD
ncbi:hypothetical protein M2272_005644 [Mycobacterium frederiksbergense]|uniref:PE-PGRS family protein n=1 Tax=Mycolicibacterium frederiksbergense TaxID=117567 RepID=A0ABT6LAH4_9MYCO|nr:hypothetical protein [Mycolicibacterium frederiksbergense]MDH6198980.1 hypothetical protein [Mycolicibacterium frederiksbergense]